MNNTPLAYTWTIGIITTCFPFLFINKACVFFYHFLAIWATSLTTPPPTKVSNQTRSVTLHTYNPTSQFAYHHSVIPTSLITAIAYTHHSIPAPLCNVALSYTTIASCPTFTTTLTQINNLPILTNSPKHLHPLTPTSNHHNLPPHKYTQTHIPISPKTYNPYIAIVALPIITPYPHTNTEFKNNPLLPTPYIHSHTTSSHTPPHT
jgi:hypothetical protein